MPLDKSNLVPLPISEIIATRARVQGVPYFANNNIADLLEEGDVERIQAEAEAAIAALLKALCIDVDNDHNTRETAKRVAKMYVREVFKGRFTEMPNVTDFPNAANLDEIYTIGPIAVRSTCSHHLVPITGEAWVAIIPSERVIGISKFVRILDWVMSRPQIQEEAAVMVANTLEKLIKPKALAVVIKAQHNCMTWRGVKEHQSTMVNSIIRGTFAEKDAARAELFAILRSQGF